MPTTMLSDFSACQSQERGGGLWCLCAVAFAASACAGGGGTDDAKVPVAVFDGDTPLIDEEPGVFSQELCSQIIDTCNEIGWNQIADSIDSSEKGNHFSQDIYVYDRGAISNPRLWEIIKPRIATLSAFVKQRKERAHASFNPNVNIPTEAPAADWIFIRKYSPNPDSTRNSTHAARSAQASRPRQH